MAKKTNAVRLVERAHIPCREHFYEYDESDFHGLHAAQALGWPGQRVFKTLVARGSRTGVNVFCIPVCYELDLKKAAKAAGDKDMELIPVKELLALTGYVRGGCSPIGMKKRYPTIVDKSSLAYEEIAVSAGERGHQMILPPQELVTLVGGKTADLILESSYKGE